MFWLLFVYCVRSYLSPVNKTFIRISKPISGDVNADLTTIVDDFSPNDESTYYFFNGSIPTTFKTNVIDQEFLEPHISRTLAGFYLVDTTHVFVNFRDPSFVYSIHGTSFVDALTARNLHDSQRLQTILEDSFSTWANFQSGTIDSQVSAGADMTWPPLLDLQIVQSALDRTTNAGWQVEVTGARRDQGPAGGAASAAGVDPWLLTALAFLAAGLCVAACTARFLLCRHASRKLPAKTTEWGKVESDSDEDYFEGPLRGSEKDEVVQRSLPNPATPVNYLSVFGEFVNPFQPTPSADTDIDMANFNHQEHAFSSGNREDTASVSSKAQRSEVEEQYFRGVNCAEQGYFVLDKNVDLAPVSSSSGFVTTSPINVNNIV